MSFRGTSVFLSQSVHVAIVALLLASGLVPGSRVPTALANDPAQVLATCKSASLAIDERLRACSDIIASSSIDTEIRIEALLERGLVFEQRSADREAIEDYSAVIASDPGHAIAHFNRANVLERLDEDQQALEDYGRAIALDPNDPDFFNNRGVLLAALGRHAEAINDFDRAITLGAADVQLWLSRAASHAEEGAIDAALADYRRALEIDPGNGEAKAGMMRLERRS